MNFVADVRLLLESSMMPMSIGLTMRQIEQSNSLARWSMLNSDFGSFDLVNNLDALVNVILEETC